MTDAELARDFGDEWGRLVGGMLRDAGVRYVGWASRRRGPGGDRDQADPGGVREYVTDAVPQGALDIGRWQRFDAAMNP
jgi:hypothetical protein